MPATPANELRHFRRLLVRYGQRLKLPSGRPIDGVYIPGPIDREDAQWAKQDTESATLMLRAVDIPADLLPGAIIQVIDTTTSYELLELPRYNITRSSAHLTVAVRTTSTLATA